MLKFVQLVFCILTSVMLYSQNSSFGVRLGVNGSEIMPYPIATNTNVGIIGGFTFVQNIKDVSFINLDILYAQKGFKNDVTFTDENARVIFEGVVSTNLNYLSIPFKYGVRLGKGKATFVRAGVVPAFNLSAKSIIDSDEWDFLNNDDLKEDIKIVDVGGVIEFGLFVRRKNGKATYLSIGANRSFVKVFDVDYESDSPKNISFDFSIGMEFGR